MKLCSFRDPGGEKSLARSRRENEREEGGMTEEKRACPAVDITTRQCMTYRCKRAAYSGVEREIQQAQQPESY